MSADRGRDVSRELTEVRTVLSRAESAISAMDAMELWRREGHEYYGPTDPDHLEMLEALQDVVERLDRWRKTGRPKHG